MIKTLIKTNQKHYKMAEAIEIIPGIPEETQQIINPFNVADNVALVDKVADLKVNDTTTTTESKAELVDNLIEYEPNNPEYFHNYYDMEYVSSKGNAEWNSIKPRWTRLPICKVSNKVLFTTKEEIAKYISEKFLVMHEQFIGLIYSVSLKTFLFILELMDFIINMK